MNTNTDKLIVAKARHERAVANLAAARTSLAERVDRATIDAVLHAETVEKWYREELLGVARDAHHRRHHRGR
jgi:hypothetical protein